MNIFAISGLINAIGIFTLGAVVYFKNRKREINIRYALFCFFVAFWSFCYFLWQIAQDRNLALFWARGLMVGAIFIPVCFLHFVLLLLDIYKTKKKIVNIGYLIFFFFLLVDLTPWFVNDVKPKMFFRFWPEPGPLFGFFLLIWLWYCMYPCYLLIRDYKKFTGIKRQQIKWVLIGILIGYSSGSTNYFLWYDIPIPPYGNFIVPIFVSMMAYAVIRLRLMDITILAVRAVIFSIVYGILLVIPLVAFFASKSILSKILLGPNWWLLPMSVAIYAVLALLAPFIYLAIQRRAEAILLKKQRHYQEIIKNLSKAMINIRDLEGLLKTITSTILEAVKVFFCAICIKDDEYKSFRLKSIHPTEAKSRFPEFISYDDSLVAILNVRKKPLLSEEVGKHAKIYLDSGLVIPCFGKDGLLAIIILGAKPNNDMYTNDDALTFENLSYSTSLAIENCTYWKEIEEHQRQARIQEMDLFSYSLAHEIDNPMNNIKTVATYLKDFFLKELSLAQEKQKEAQLGLEAILESQGRVSGMVKAIEEFGKPIAGEFGPLKLEAVLKNYLDLYLPEFKYHGIFFTKELPEKIPYIRGVKQELMQILANFSNNSIHALLATKEKKIHLKIEVPNSDFIRIIFKDNGYGIRQEKLSSIFAPFVTSKASTEGKGMGLYTIRRIIERHKGRVWAESEGKGKGATFYIELPIAKDVTEEDFKKEDRGKRLF